MKLNEIPEGSKILLPIGGENRETKDEMCTFEHLDGMYSLIRTPDGHAVHLSGFAPLIEVGDHYELEPSQEEKRGSGH